MLTGLLFIVTGVITFANPQGSYLALAIFFSVAFLVGGIFEIIFAISNRKEIDGWGWTLVLGILTAIVGGMLVARPDVSMATLPFYVGFVLMFRSFSAIATAMDLKNYGILDWGNMMVLGVLGTLFSFFLIFNPVFGGLTIVFWTGIGFLVLGIYSIYMSFRLRKLKRTVEGKTKPKASDS